MKLYQRQNEQLSEATAVRGNGTPWVDAADLFEVPDDPNQREQSNH